MRFMNTAAVIGVTTATGLATSWVDGAMTWMEPGANAERPVGPAVVHPIAPHDRPVIQLALLFDTSNSMDGLIDQARAALWAVVNEMALAKHGGETPELQVALIEYGNSSVPSSLGHVRVRTNFTTDLDLLSEQLFGLRTNGGDEWCGRAIGEANDVLWWWDQLQSNCRVALPESLGDAAMGAVREGLTAGRAVERPGVRGPVVKVLVVAGNEPFSQGSTPYQETIAAARASGVVVSTVYCGDRKKGAATRWEDGARLGGGLYASIDSDRRVAEPPTPYDDRLSKLNVSLNATYLPYGVSGEALAQRQVSQDRLNSAAGVGMRRMAAKSGVNYVQAEWDLVDAIDQGLLKLKDIELGGMPESFRGLTIEEQRARVDSARSARAGVREQMAEVAAEREAFLEAWRAERAAVPATLDTVLVDGVREQVAARGYTFED
ncbi:MAG: hypothetical protein AAF297_06770 [Planctomycetota bacterium]